MKTSFIHLLATTLIATSPLVCHGQEPADSALQEKISKLDIVPYLSGGTENPRGVYKLTWLRDKNDDLIKEPFDQYKICTDSVTLMFTVNGNRFMLGKNDSQVFNYTGEEPDANNATATRIFDSNAEHFTLKWWSNYSYHIYFPQNDWCTEYYQSGKYSEEAKLILNALMSPPTKDPKNPLIGTWKQIGMVDDLRDVKKEMKRIREKPLGGIYTIFTPSSIVGIARNNGMLYPSPNPYNKNVFKVGQTENKITWLSKDLIAVEVHQDYRTDYQILERVAQGTAFDGIASHHVIH